MIAARIAGHAGDIVKVVKGAREWGDQMSRARKALNWGEMFRLSIDPKRAQAMRRESIPANKRVCTMCGEFCAMRVVEDIL